MVFTGTYQRSLDEKLRVLLPKQLRQALPEDRLVYLTPGADGCLELHTPGSLEVMAQSIPPSSPSSQNQRAFARLFYARACQCELDRQDRIRIPQPLAEQAGLTREVVLVGVGHHWELWQLERWERYLEQNATALDPLWQSPAAATSPEELDDASTPRPR